MSEILLFWKVAWSSLSLSVLLDIDLNTIFTSGLLDVLAIIFLLFGLLLFVFNLRKGSSSHRRANGGNAPKRPVGALSLVVIALPLLVLLLVWSNIPSTPKLIIQTPTPTPTHGSQKPIPTPTLVLHTPGMLTIGSDTTYPPQDYLDNNKHPIGFDIDLITAIAKKMGLNVTFVSEKFDPLMSDLASKKLDVVISALAIPASSQQVQYVPYLNSIESLVVLKGTSQNIKSLNDLCGMNVGILAGSSVQSDFNDAKTTCTNAGKGDITLTPEPDTKTIVQMLQSKTINVAYMDAPVANYYVMQNKNTLMIVGKPVSEKIQEGIAIRQGDNAMFNAVQQAFQAVQKDRTYKMLLDQWGFTSESL